jgi:hypothetical protein
LNVLASTAEEFERLAATLLPELLDRAAAQTRQFLREMGQWADDVAHEKLALRWGYELLERFLVCGRTEVPCRLFFLLDSVVAKTFSRPDPFCYHKDLLSPVGRFLDGLTARAVVSRDALIALFHHWYGFGQRQVVRLLGLGPVESQRVYKNFERWRQSGWQRVVNEMGLTREELEQLEQRKARHSLEINAEAGDLLRIVLVHYRKSEPEHFPCLTRQEWAALFAEDCEYDYRVWHLALCPDCLATVHDVRRGRLADIPAPRVDLQIRPLKKGGIVSLVAASRGGGNGTRAGRTAQRLSGTSA